MSGKKEPHQFSKLAEELVGDLRGVPFDDPKRSKKRATQSLAVVVEQLLQLHQIGRESPEHTIRAHWPTIVGAANASYSHPALIQRNMLNVLAGHVSCGMSSSTTAKKSPPASGSCQVADM